MAARASVREYGANLRPAIDNCQPADATDPWRARGSKSVLLPARRPFRAIAGIDGRPEHARQPMRVPKPTKLGWSWPRGAALRYCAKVPIASLLGYVLSIGGVAYALYGAFTGALVVGASRGEDVNSAANRARGSIAGMLVGIGAADLAPHPGIAVAVGIGLTAFVCLGCGWGQAAARIGASLCAVTILAHSQDALEYSALRVIDTLIGIGAGLAVSYFVWPVRGRDQLDANIRKALEAVARLLTALSLPEPAAGRAEYRAVYDSMVALDKTLADARHEIGGNFDELRDEARHVVVVCVASLTAALAHLELGERAGALEAAAGLRAQAAGLAERARATEPGPGSAPSTPFTQDDLDGVALQAMALGLHKVDDALRALGH
jgi:uncharacterized membrane protein YccC